MIRDLIPARWRRWCYAVAAVLVPVLAYIGGRVGTIGAIVLSASGFSLAAGNVPPPSSVMTELDG